MSTQPTPVDPQTSSDLHQLSLAASRVAAGQGTPQERAAILEAYVAWVLHEGTVPRAAPGEDLDAFGEWLLNEREYTPSSVNTAKSRVRWVLANDGGCYYPADKAYLRRYQEFRGEATEPLGRRGRRPRTDLEAFQAYMVWDKFSKGTINAVCAEVRRERRHPTKDSSYAKETYHRWRMWVRKCRAAAAQGHEVPGPWQMATIEEVPETGALWGVT